MAKRKISAKAILADIRSGMGKAELMDKYSMSAQSYERVIQKLIDNLILTEAEASGITQTSSGAVQRDSKDAPTEPVDSISKPAMDPQSAKLMNRPIQPAVRDRIAASADPPSETGCAWDDYWKNKGDLGIFRAYFRTVSQCLRSPTEFFSNMPRGFGYWAPALFGGIAMAVPTTFWLIFFEILKGGVGISNVAWALFLGAWIFVGVIVLGTICFFIFASIVHGFLKLLGAAQSGFQATFRVIAYSCVASLFGFVPLIGVIVVNLWSLYLIGIGLRETHETSTGKAFSAVLIPECAFVAITVLLGLYTNYSTASRHSSSAGKSSISREYSGTEYGTKGARFSVVTPVPLKRKMVTAKKLGVKIDVSIYSARQNNIEFSVISVEVPFPSFRRILKYFSLSLFSRPPNLEELLDKYCIGITRKLTGKLVKSKRIMLDQNPGRECVIELKDKGGNDKVVKGRAFVVHDKMYQLMVVASPEEIDAEAVTEFFDSFQVLTE